MASLKPHSKKSKSQLFANPPTDKEKGRPSKKKNSKSKLIQKKKKQEVSSELILQVLSQSDR